jgi:hypothetical protein
LNRWSWTRLKKTRRRKLKTRRLRSRWAWPKRWMSLWLFWSATDDEEDALADCDAEAVVDVELLAVGEDDCVEVPEAVDEDDEVDVDEDVEEDELVAVRVRDADEEADALDDSDLVAVETTTKWTMLTRKPSMCQSCWRIERKWSSKDDVDVDELVAVLSPRRRRRGGGAAGLRGRG